MQQYEVATLALTQRANAERLYMQYALTLAVLFAVMGAALIVLGLGDHLDILIQSSGQVEARLLNASPGVVLWLLSAGLFWFARPRRLRGAAHHEEQSTEAPSEIERTLRDAEHRINLMLAAVEGRTQAIVDFLDDNDIDPHTLRFRHASANSPKDQLPPRQPPSNSPRAGGGVSFELGQSPVEPLTRKPGK